MKYVYMFNETNKDMRDLVGGKGANLGEMVKLGLNVPNGFSVSTEACLKYFNKDREFLRDLSKEIISGISKLEEDSNLGFGDIDNPLLVSVRSGAPVSMPGMMDTVLNVGLNQEIVDNCNNRYMYDSYRRLIYMFSDVVMGYDTEKYDAYLKKYKDVHEYSDDSELSIDDLENIVHKYKEIFKSFDGKDFPEDPKAQLLASCFAVFKSWNNERAKVYRRLNNIPDSYGTAVNVERMVYGNKNDKSLTGVLFSMNPNTGEDELYGEYLVNAQGEDIVSGARTPKDIHELQKEMPNIYEELASNIRKLEKHYHDMQDVEFTVEDGELFILQTRNGKRSAKASIRIALNLLDKELISEEECIKMISASDISSFLHKVFDKNSMSDKEIIGKGIPASMGAASGKIYFNVNDIFSHKDDDTILAREETVATDVLGMHYASGILTAKGGMTSHAAVVARSMGTPCVSGVKDLVINEEEKILVINDKEYHEGDYISIDGDTGDVYAGEILLEDAQTDEYFDRFMQMIDKYQGIKVRTNADTVEDVVKAISFGASGVGLCRSEHMFFKESRINVMRELILATDLEERTEALAKLKEFQEEDFYQMMKVLGDMPIIIRYLDPPLHEFLPRDEDAIVKLANDLGVDRGEIIKRCDDLREVNPMMGNRGSRLLVNYNDIAIMQTEAIIDASFRLNEMGIVPDVEIMIPLVSISDEYLYIKKIIEDVINIRDVKMNVKIGSMIETPRACLTFPSFVDGVDFISFGTNDLTQLCYGFSRDDASSFLDAYYKNNILKDDPFKVLDYDGVGLLMRLVMKVIAKNHKQIDVGICGEVGTNSATIKFAIDNNIDYISCSPYMIPAVKLEIARVIIDNKK